MHGLFFILTSSLFLKSFQLALLEDLWDTHHRQMQTNRSIAEDECVQDQIDKLIALPLLQKHCFLTHPTEMQKLRKGTMRDFACWSKRMRLASAKCNEEEQKGQQKIENDV